MGEGGRGGGGGGGEGEGGGIYPLVLDLLLERTPSMLQSLYTHPKVSKAHDQGRWGGARVLSGAPAGPRPGAAAAVGATTAALVQGVEETLAGCSEGAWVLAGPSGSYPIIVVSGGLFSSQALRIAAMLPASSQ